MCITEKSSILLPHIIKQNAQTDPSGVFARIPAGAKYSDGYKDVTKLQLDNAVNHTASLIKQNLGDSKDFGTLAYIGPGDLRYSIVVVAGIKAGYKVRPFLSMSCPALESSDSIRRSFCPHRGTARRRTFHF
jgi:hypothetical protein